MDRMRQETDPKSDFILGFFHDDVDIAEPGHDAKEQKDEKENWLGLQPFVQIVADDQTDHQGQSHGNSHGTDQGQ
jgi:hypothetical protein